LTTTPEDTRAGADREQTDESLRVEREKADGVVGAKLSAVDEAADAVIETARARADAVLAAARSRSDRLSNTPGSARTFKVVESRRILEDEAVQRERSEADATIRAERAEHASLLAAERAETDEDLSRERERADVAVDTRDEFLGIVSHDLRNMLGAMVGYAALIVQAEALPAHGEMVVAYAERIRRSGGRMNRLIGDLADLASIRAGSLAVTPEIGDPTAIVTEAVDTFRAKALAGGVSLVADLAPSLPLAAFDSARILQVLANLLSNAIKFTSPEGQVTVRTERAGDDICFSVSDTGIGVPPDQLEAVFERYVQVAKDDRRGVGLGLYISRRIVYGHGGRIWAESTLGQGSVFHFTLPIHAARV
jgi:signal transduction histidine kinase